MKRDCNLESKYEQKTDTKTERGAEHKFKTRKLIETGIVNKGFWGRNENLKQRLMGQKVTENSDSDNEIYSDSEQQIHDSNVIRNKNQVLRWQWFLMNSNFHEQNLE